MKYYTRKKLTYEYINSINTLWGGNKMSRFYCRDEELRKLNKRYENTVIKNRFGRTGTDSGICSSLWERNKLPLLHFLERRIYGRTTSGTGTRRSTAAYPCNGVQREHNKKLNNGLPILHKVPPKRDYGRYFCIMAEKGGTSHGGLTEKLSLFFHAKKQEVNAYGR